MGSPAVTCTWWLLGLAVKVPWLGPCGPILALAAWTGFENAGQKWRYDALKACIGLKVVSSENNSVFRGLMLGSDSEPSENFNYFSVSSESPHFELPWRLACL